MIKLPGFSLKGNNKIFVGFNIGDNFCQLSFSQDGKNVETVSLTTGEEDYNIPTALCKREGVNQWFFGKEAFEHSRDEDCIYIDHLLSLARRGAPILVDQVPYQPVSLLALFIKRCMSLVTAVYSDRVSGVLFTAENLTYENIGVLKEAVSLLKLKTEKIYFQSRMESYYHFMTHQPDELWRNGSILLEYEKDEVIAYRMESNFGTIPVVVYIDEKHYPMPGGSRDNSADTDYELIQLDRTFANIAREACEAEDTISVFLIGSGYNDVWMKESKKYLCSKYRVFQGSNLYSKGACYGLIDRNLGEPIEKKNIFLGNDKLTANVGMNILSQNDETYYAILDAGVSWYDAGETFEFYIQDGNYIEFIIRSLVGSGDRIARITLDDFSQKISRMRCKLYMESEKLLIVEIEDLGFGEFRPSTHKIWREEIPIN
ncbi:MAG: hypothetical protein IKR35_03285 [Lachnospiraceae bacterium]|nr:hypothetical protein [Lachnospiraceae bacterium]